MSVQSDLRGDLRRGIYLFETQPRYGEPEGIAEGIAAEDIVVPLKKLLDLLDAEEKERRK